MEQYSVERLREIKRCHEAKFTDIVSTIQNSFLDHTEFNSVKLARTLARFNTVLEWNLDHECLSVNQEEVRQFAVTLGDVPIQARQVLSLMVKRADFEHINGFCITVHEVKLVTGVRIEVLAETIEVLEKYGFLKEGESNSRGQPIFTICEFRSGWCFAAELKKFCEAENIAIDEVLVDLNFRLLD